MKKRWKKLKQYALKCVNWQMTWSQGDQTIDRKCVGKRKKNSGIADSKNKWGSKKKRGVVKIEGWAAYKFVCCLLYGFFLLLRAWFMLRYAKRWVCNRLEIVVINYHRARRRVQAEHTETFDEKEERQKDGESACCWLCKRNDARNFAFPAQCFSLGHSNQRLQRLTSE